MVVDIVCWGRSCYCFELSERVQAINNIIKELQRLKDNLESKCICLLVDQIVGGWCYVTFGLRTFQILQEPAVSHRGQAAFEKSLHHADLIRYLAPELVLPAMFQLTLGKH